MTGNFDEELPQEFETNQVKESGIRLYLRAATPAAPSPPAAACSMADAGAVPSGGSPRDVENRARGQSRSQKERILPEAET